MYREMWWTNSTEQIELCCLYILTPFYSGYPSSWTCLKATQQPPFHLDLFACRGMAVCRWRSLFHRLDHLACMNVITVLAPRSPPHPHLLSHRLPAKFRMSSFEWHPIISTERGPGVLWTWTSTWPPMPVSDIKTHSHLASVLPLRAPRSTRLISYG